MHPAPSNGRFENRSTAQLFQLAHRRPLDPISLHLRPLINENKVVDFAVERNNEEGEAQLGPVAQQQLLRGFAHHGFVYVRNHGIEQHEIERVFSTSDSFFNLSDETKEKYRVKPGASDKHGYVPINGEILGANTRKEFRECFNVTRTTNGAIFPETECPGFTAAVAAFYRRCSTLALTILRALAVVLQLEDEDYFSKIHLPMDTVENFSTLRLLNYPATTAGGYDEQGSVRCGEHSDYGTVTLLFQDGTGGLEVKTRSGNYLQVKPVPETIVVNVGNILEYMTAGKVVAARHRVLLDGACERRRSVAFFAHPAHDAMVQRLQEPKDTSPISSYDFVKRNFDATYTI